jgi:predicted nucleotidyltransferase
LATSKLRDRDAIVTREGLIFRVFGYSHPSKAYICDAEYAPAEIFKSNNPKAFRNKGRHVFYKFYEDEGWKFVNRIFPQHTIFHEMLCRDVVGVYHSNVVKVRKPGDELGRLVETRPKDELVSALQNVLEVVTQCCNLSTKIFGLFGSMLHGFHHPRFSDIDLIIYGGKKAVRLYENLQELYRRESSTIKNEFETDELVRGKLWRFPNYSPKEYVWHQRRKTMYALFNDEGSGRVIKTEFEPVQDWEEIRNEYDAEARIVQKGWTKILARVVEDRDAPFIPSIYGIETLRVLKGAKEAVEASRIISYMEEFRMQARRDEAIYVEGNLEEVVTPRGNFYQVTLTYCPRYYEQALKVVSENYARTI